MSAEKLNQRPGFANKKTVNPHDMSEAQRIGAARHRMRSVVCAVMGTRRTSHISSPQVGQCGRPVISDAAVKQRSVCGISYDQQSSPAS